LERKISLCRDIFDIDIENLNNPPKTFRINQPSKVAVYKIILNSVEIKKMILFKIALNKYIIRT
jgi:hypothetical protein